MKRVSVILLIGLTAAEIFAQQGSRADTALAISAFPNVEHLEAKGAEKLGNLAKHFKGLLGT